MYVHKARLSTSASSVGCDMFISIFVYIVLWYRMFSKYPNKHKICRKCRNTFASVVLCLRELHAARRTPLAARCTPHMFLDVVVIEPHPKWQLLHLNLSAAPLPGQTKRLSAMGKLKVCRAHASRLRTLTLDSFRFSLPSLAPETVLRHYRMAAFWAPPAAAFGAQLVAQCCGRVSLADRQRAASLTMLSCIWPPTREHCVGGWVSVRAYASPLFRRINVMYSLHLSLYLVFSFT